MVIVADANSVFRSGVIALLEREPDIRAIPSTSAEMLIGQVSALRPSVVLIDINLAPSGGARAMERIKRRASMTELVAIATAPDREIVLTVVRAGARGIIERNVHSTSLARIVRRAAAGEVTLPRRVLGYVLDELARTDRQFDTNSALNGLSSQNAKSSH